MAYKRIILKLSGEALCNEGSSGHDSEAIEKVLTEIKPLVESGIHVAVVIGGGNIWRYRDNKDADLARPESDKQGMIATVKNGVAIKEVFEKNGVPTYVCSAIDSDLDVERFDRHTAIQHLQDGDVVVCTGGTSNPYFTTDSAAALRALELECDILIKATNVDGIYNKDPDEHKDAVLYEDITYDDAISQNLKVMDTTAFSLCRENGMKICVINFGSKGALLKAANGEKIGTLVHA